MPKQHSNIHRRDKHGFLLTRRLPVLREKGDGDCRSDKVYHARVLFDNRRQKQVFERTARFKLSAVIQKESHILFDKMDALLDSTSATVAVAFLLILATFRLLVIPYLESRKPYDGIRTCPKSHWLFGHARMTHGRDSFPESHLYVYNNTDQHGRVAYWMVHKRCIGIKNITDARHILKVESQRSRIPIISHYVGKVIGNKNLLFLNGREWKQNRDAVTRTFVHSFLVQSQQDMYQVTQDLIVTLQGKMEGTKEPLELDMFPVMKMVTSDVIGKAAFGTNFDCCKTLTNSKIVSAFEYMMNDMSARCEKPLMPWNYFFALPLEKNRKLDEQVIVLRSFIEKLIHQARINMKKAEVCPSPTSAVDFPETAEKSKMTVMDRLVAANDSAESSSTDQVLVDVVSTLLIASYDTTSTTLAFALYLLAMNPNIQDLCSEEVESVLKNSADGKLANPELLVYCSALISECLRLYPPAAISSRTLSKPVTLADGFVVPKGAHCVIPIFAIHRDEQYFPQPMTCRPDRWCRRESDSSPWVERHYRAEKDNDNATIPAGNMVALIPFSAGGRQCPGAKFALQEAVLVLANLVHDFRVLPKPGYKLKLNLKGPLPFPKDGMPLLLEKR